MEQLDVQTDPQPAVMPFAEQHDSQNDHRSIDGTPISLRRKLKIAYIYARTDTMGGAPIHVRDMAKRLNQDGHEAKVWVGGNGPFFQNLKEHNVPVRTLKHLRRAPHPIHDLWGVFEIYAEMRRFKPDFISTHCAKAGFLGRIAGRMLRIPTIYTPHCWPFTDRAPKRRLYLWLEKKVVGWTHRIFLVAENERKEALEHKLCDTRLMTTIHNGMPDVVESERADPSRSPPRMIMVARFEAQKDHDTLFRALGRLSDLDWTIDLIGGGPLEDEFKQRAKTLGIAHRVNFVGHTTRVAPYLANAQIFLLITRWEGFPRSVLEGMRAGLPLVVTDVGGNREAFVNNDEGYLVSQGDSDSLAGFLRKLIENPVIRKRFGRQSRSTYQSHFTFERMYQQYSAAYRVLMKEIAHDSRE